MLADGGRIETDAIVAATGFRTGLERLVGHLDVLDERGRPLVRDVEEPAGAPGLHFVGYEITLGGTLRLVGVEAKELARRVAAARAGAADLGSTGVRTHSLRAAAVEPRPIALRDPLPDPRRSNRSWTRSPAALEPESPSGGGTVGRRSRAVG